MLEKLLTVFFEVVGLLCRNVVEDLVVQLLAEDENVALFLF